MTEMTTSDLKRRAENLYVKAEFVSTRIQHARFWDSKVIVLNQINDALETGYYSGEALEDLRVAKQLLHDAETLAGKRAMETYMKQ